MHLKSPRFIFGIPTVYRNSDINGGSHYLLETIKQLISGINVSSLKADQASIITGKNILILVTIGETNITSANKIYDDISQKFSAEIKRGLILVIKPKLQYYPDLKFGKDVFFDDVEERQRWRTKQNLDYIYLWLQTLNFKKDNSKEQQYLMQLEDDLTIPITYLDKINENLRKYSSEDLNSWQMMEFVKTGFIGKLFKFEFLHELMVTSIMQYKRQPCDWILETVMNERFCPHIIHTDKNRCKKLMTKFAPFVNSKIFIHAGKYSSLNGQIRELEDKSDKKKKTDSISSAEKTKIEFDEKIRQERLKAHNKVPPLRKGKIIYGFS